MTIPTEIAEAIVDPKAYADGKRVDEAFSLWLRREMPLAVARRTGFDPFWVVTRHADILEVERQNDLFHNGDRATTVTPIDLDQKVRMADGRLAASAAHARPHGQSRPRAPTAASPMAPSCRRI